MSSKDSLWGGVSNAIQVKSSDIKWQQYTLKAIRIPLKSVYHTGRKALYLYTNSP